MIGGTTWVGIQKGAMLGESISHERASSQKYIDGMRKPGEAQGAM